MKQRPQEFLSRCAECLLNLLSDESPGVLKYAIRGAGEVFRRVLHSLCAERGAVSPACSSTADRRGALLGVRLVCSGTL